MTALMLTMTVEGGLLPLAVQTQWSSVQFARFALLCTVAAV
jgi:hypothetical protein